MVYPDITNELLIPATKITGKYIKSLFKPYHKTIRQIGSTQRFGQLAIKEVLNEIQGWLTFPDITKEQKEKQLPEIIEFISSHLERRSGSSRRKAKRKISVKPKDTAQEIKGYTTDISPKGVGFKLFENLWPKFYEGDVCSKK